MNGLGRVIERVKEGVEKDGVDAWIARTDKWITGGAWAAIVASILYFAPICIGILLR